MSIASEITRLQGVKSDILQAISDKGVTVPDGSALADCPELIGLIPTGGGLHYDGFVNIEGERYPYKKINNRVWILENFRNVTGLNFSSSLSQSNTTSYVYPISKNSNDLNLLKITGALYNYPAVKYISQNYDLNGFRIPSISDFLDLKNISCSDLKSVSSWANNSGNDKYNFCAIATGYVFSGEIANSLHTTDFWTSEHNDDTYGAVNFWFGESQSQIVQESNGYNNGFCLRLCMDA